jgi:hypothetical protein
MATDAQLSGPLPPEQFTQTLYSRHHGTEVGIRGDTDGSAFGITLPPAGDTAEFGSATVDSICKIGGYPLIVPAGSSQSLEIPAPLSGGTTGRTDLIVARYAPATYTTAPGPVRLFRIAGTAGSATRPAYSPATDLRLYAVQRRQGEALNQAIVADLRSWSGPMILMASGAALPQSAPLGSRVARDGTIYLRTFVGTTVDWVVESTPATVISGVNAIEAPTAGWTRQSGSYLERNDTARWVHGVLTKAGASLDALASGGMPGGDISIGRVYDIDKPPAGVVVAAAARVTDVDGNTYMAGVNINDTGFIQLNSTLPNVKVRTVLFDARYSAAAVA